MRNKTKTCKCKAPCCDMEPNARDTNVVSDKKTCGECVTFGQAMMHLNAIIETATEIGALRRSLTLMHRETSPDALVVDAMVHFNDAQNDKLMSLLRVFTSWMEDRFEKEKEE